MWRNIKSLSPHINLLINIHTRDDEEHSRTTSATCEEQPKAEYDSSLIFLVRDLVCTKELHLCWYLNHFDNKEEGQWQGDRHQQDGEDGQEKRADAWTFFTDWNGETRLYLFTNI